MAILVRGLERLAALGAGAFTVYLGFRLFSLLPITQTNSRGELELPGVKVVVAQVSQGLLFAGMGAVLIGISLESKVELERRQETYEAAGRRETGHLETLVVEKQTFAGSLPGRIVLPPAELAQQMGELNCLSQVSTLPRVAYPGDAGAALESAKEALLLSSWQPAWGDPSMLRSWIDGDVGVTISREVELLYTSMRDGCPEN